MLVCLPTGGESHPVLEGGYAIQLTGGTPSFLIGVIQGTPVLSRRMGVHPCQLDGVGGGELITIEETSLRPHGYQLLPLATTQLVGNNMEFDVSGIFLPVLLIVGGGKINQ